MANEMRDRLVKLCGNSILSCKVSSCEDCEQYTKNDYPYCMAEYLADRLIENGVVFPQWISVKDRLPDVSGRYLTHCDVEGQSLVCILYFEQFVYGFEKEITHWMLLPKPPKAEQKLKEMRGENG